MFKKYTILPVFKSGNDSLSFVPKTILIVMFV